MTAGFSSHVVPRSQPLLTWWNITAMTLMGCVWTCVKPAHRWLIVTRLVVAILVVFVVVIRAGLVVNVKKTEVSHRLLSNTYLPCHHLPLTMHHSVLFSSLPTSAVSYHLIVILLMRSISVSRWHLPLLTGSLIVYSTITTWPSRPKSPFIAPCVCLFFSLAVKPGRCTVDTSKLLKPITPSHSRKFSVFTGGTRSLTPRCDAGPTLTAWNI